MANPRVLKGWSEGSGHEIQTVGAAPRGPASGAMATARGRLAPVVRLLALALLGFSSSGCAVAHYYGSISGRVVDKETGRPIEGAAVVAVYNASIASAGGPVRQYGDCQETKTDAKGEFVMPSKFVFAPKIGIGTYESEPKIYVAMPGYGEYGRHHEANKKILPDGSTEYSLPPLITVKERNLWSSWQPLELNARDKLPYFIYLLNEENKYLGLELLEE